MRRRHENQTDAARTPAPTSAATACPWAPGSARAQPGSPWRIASASGETRRGGPAADFAAATPGDRSRWLKAGRYAAPERLGEGLVVCLDGVGGYNWLPRWLRRGLDQGGVRAAIVIYDWSVGPLGLWVTDLLLRGRNRTVAQELAGAVAAYCRRWPGRPVTLIGHSGGGGIVAWALEALPPDCRVNTAVLLAPALSPGYNLAAALRAVGGNLYATYSWLDFGLMGLGTTLFGTIDRRHGPSAGLVGFRLPRGITPEDRQAYTRVRQIGWRPEMIRDGHVGDHVGWTTARFARRFLAPILLGLSDPGQPLADRRQAPAVHPPPSGRSVE